MNRSGSVRVLEYTDLPPSLASKLDDHGNLVYGSGNICNHIVSLGFLEKVGVAVLFSGFNMIPQVLLMVVVCSYS